MDYDENWFNLVQGFDAVQSESHIQAQVYRIGSRYSPFRAYGFAFGLAGRLAATLQV